MERPMCAIPGCNNPGLIFVYQKFWCGECYVKLKEKIDKQEQNKIEQIFNDWDLDANKACNLDGESCESCQ